MCRVKDARRSTHCGGGWRPVAQGQYQCRRGGLDETRDLIPQFGQPTEEDEEFQVCEVPPLCPFDSGLAPSINKRQRDPLGQEA